VPHIYAQNAADGWFALGYVHAQDRLWQMDIQYRAAAGRLSEVLGASYVSTDQFFRTIGLERIAKLAAVARAAAGQDDTVVMNAYTAGVNAYIVALDPPDYAIEFKLLGYKPEAWSVEKSLTAGGLIAWSLMGDFNDLQYNLLVQKFGAVQANELFPDYPAGTQYPIQPSSLTRPEVSLLSVAAARDILKKAAAAAPWIPNFQGVGSNNWAVLGTRTTTGKPLLDADPHLQFQLPAVWYEAELQAPPYSLRGATFPGIPAFFFGTNGHIAWGETNTGADVNDFFVEHLSANGTQYLYGGHWYNLIVYDEPIGVKGGTTVHFKVDATRHGPILTQYDQTVSMQSTIVYFGQELEAMLGINRAQNSDEFNASAQGWRVPAQNIIYADANGAYGNIGIRSTGLYPIRGNFSGRLPVDGSNASYAWIGWVPFDSYPHLWDPPQGYVSSNNQVPYPPGYAYPSSLGSLFDPGYRARRIHELLAADAKVSFADMQRFQLDVLDTAAQSLVPYLLAAVHPADGVERGAYDALSSWDYNMTVDAVAASVWYTFMDHYVQDTFGDEYAAQGVTNLSYPQFNTLENLTINDPMSHWFNNVTGGSVKVQTRDDVLRQAFNDTVTDLTSRLGPMTASWTWGTIHFREFDQLSGLSALQRGPLPVGGDGFTLNVAGGLISKGGPSWRQIIDFSDLDNSLAIYPGGQSGNPLSVHYDDFLSSYMNGKYLSFRAYPTPESIPAASVESTITLVSS
jgi:penicillin amidase